MSVHAPSLPASPSTRPSDVDVRRLFQTPTMSVAGPSSRPAQSAQPTQSSSSNPNPHPPHHHGRRQHVSRNRFYAELSQCLFDFVIQLLPTQEELRIKEDVRKLLERLIRTIEPNSRLLSFGSTANGFALRNSDMDMCCLIDSDQRLNAADLVTMLGDLLERETKFSVKPLPYARIPIVKLSLDPSPGLPQGIACDIGFENKLALENTRLLMCYAMIDPARVRTMVLFLKVWSKRRKINSPYRGTLSSYGYVLMVLYFLTHVKNPPVLPNLQQIPPLRPMPTEDMQLNGHNIWFFDDIELLRQRWQSQNTETVAELLADFFKYYSRDFSYNSAVISLRAGAMRKEAKGWQSTAPGGKYEDPRERNRFCIEDPFEVEFNVARCVSKDGLYLIRGEFMRAHRVFQARPDRAVVALSQLCEERQQEELPPLGAVSFIPPRPPPQTPYTVGGNSMRPQVVPAPIAEEPAKGEEEEVKKEEKVPAEVQNVQEETNDNSEPAVGQGPPPPDHMAPRRSQYTSPPPPDAPLADLVSFEDRLGHGLSLATAATEARQREYTGETSASASEIFTDDGRISDIADLDDVRSVRSFTEESHSTPQWSPQIPPSQSPSMAYSYSAEAGIDPRKLPASPLSSGWKPKNGNSLRAATFRGRRYGNGKLDENKEASPSPTSSPSTTPVEWPAGPSRRSASGPPRSLAAHRYSLPPTDTFIPVHPMLVHRLPLLQPSPTVSTSTVFYETGTSPGKDRNVRPDISPASTPASPATYAARPYVAMMSPYPHPLYPHHLMDPRMFAYSAATASAAVSPLETTSPTTFTRWNVPSHEQLTAVAGEAITRQRTGSGPKTPTPTPTNGGGLRRKTSHSHSHSTATVVPNESGNSKLKPTAPKKERSNSKSHSPERPHQRKTKSKSRSRSRAVQNAATAQNAVTESSVETPKQEDGPQLSSSLSQPSVLLAPGRWSPMSRRADSPHSLGTDSPAPSSPTSSNYVTSPSTSPPSPSLDHDKNSVSAPPQDHDLCPADRPPSGTGEEKKSPSGTATILSDVNAAEKTPVGGSFVQTAQAHNLLDQ